MKYTLEGIMENIDYILIKERFPPGSFDNIFRHITNIMCHIKNNYYMNLDILAFGECANGIIHCRSVNDLLVASIRLISDGTPDEYFYFVLDYEFIRLTDSKNNLTELQLIQLYIMKQSIVYLRNGAAIKFYHFSRPLCSIHTEILDQLSASFLEIEELFRCTTNNH